VPPFILKLGYKRKQETLQPLLPKSLLHIIKALDWGIRPQGTLKFTDRYGKAPQYGSATLVQTKNFLFATTPKFHELLQYKYPDEMLQNFKTYSLNPLLQKNK